MRALSLTKLRLPRVATNARLKSGHLGGLALVAVNLQVLERENCARVREISFKSLDESSFSSLPSSMKSLRQNQET